MQIVGRAFDEPTVLGIGAAYEAATNLHQRRPSFGVAKAA
jgi:aspartyl-tRNA(Asn)/glutamyl-tRNA(Gln) amidotransferase subunit A